MSQPTDKFVRRRNVERYKRLLLTVLKTDEKRRDVLLKLLAEAKKAQKDAGDPQFVF